FLQKNPSHERVPEAQRVQVQVLNAQGKALLSRALRQETPAAQQAEALRARPVLAEAGNQMKQIVDQENAELNKKGEPKTPKEKEAYKALENAKLQAELDLAVNLLDQAQTFLQQGKAAEAKARLELIKNAQAILESLERLTKSEPKNPVGWLARAWLGRSFQ